MMKTLVLFALFIFPTLGFSDESSIASDLGRKHAQIFSSLVQEYCITFREDPEKLEEKLLADGFSKEQDYDGTYVKYIRNVDYAVTLDQDVCTTDVLLKPGSSMLFALDQIEASLSSRLKLKLNTSKSEIDYELSSEDKRTKVAKRSYVDRQGKEYTLVFPLENFSEYYMTFDVHLDREKVANYAN